MSGLARSERNNCGDLPGALCSHPFDGREIPIWISEYVLAVMEQELLWPFRAAISVILNFAKHFRYSHHQYYWQHSTVKKQTLQKIRS